MAPEAKPFASLSSGLLARKGAARPAMRPQGFGQTGSNPEDLGWDDMGFEQPKPLGLTRDNDPDAFNDDFDALPRHHPTGLTPVNSPVHDQQVELAVRLNEADDSTDEEVDETAELYVPDETAAPEAPPVVSQRVEQSEPVAMVTASKPVALVPATKAAEPASRAPSRPRAAPGSKARAAFTLRLDPDRHLKLRLACAVDGRSAQQLVTAALDQMLERMPELNGLAAKAKSRG